MTSHVSVWMKRYPLFVYSVLALGITSICQVPMQIIASMKGYIIYRSHIIPINLLFIEVMRSGFVDAQQAVIFAIFTFGVYGPALAAIIVTIVEKGKAGLRKLFGRSIKWRVGIKWYLALVLLPIVTTISTVGLGVLFGILIPNFYFVYFFEPAIPLQYIIPFLLFIMFTSGLEELGWRGYALPKLQTKYNAWKSSYVLGTIWGLWYWPFLVCSYYLTGIIACIIASGGIIIVDVEWTLFLYTLSTIAVTIIYTWFYNNTESIFICILLHTWINFTGFYILGYVTHPFIGLIQVLIMWVVAGILLKIFGKERLSRKTDS